MNKILYTQDLWKIYSNGVQALKGVSIEIYQGEIVGLMGPSGSGKSTLLHLIAGLEKPTKGKIYLFGEDISLLDEDKLAELRQRSLAFIFQFYYLLEDFTVLENLTLIGSMAGLKNPKEKALEILEYLRLSHRLNHKPSQLSGGEQQRVAIGRALMLEAKLVLADEPTGNLDFSEGRRIFDLFLKLKEEKGITFFVATHNQDLIPYFDRLYKIKDGSLEIPL